MGIDTCIIALRFPNRSVCCVLKIARAILESLCFCFACQNKLYDCSINSTNVKVGTTLFITVWSPDRTVACGQETAGLWSNALSHSIHSIAPLVKMNFDVPIQPSTPAKLPADQSITPLRFCDPPARTAAPRWGMTAHRRCSVHIRGLPWASPCWRSS